GAHPGVAGARASPPRRWPGLRGDLLGWRAGRRRDRRGGWELTARECYRPRKLTAPRPRNVVLPATYTTAQSDDLTATPAAVPPSPYAGKSAIPPVGQ